MSKVSAFFIHVTGWKIALNLFLAVLSRILVQIGVKSVKIAISLLISGCLSPSLRAIHAIPDRILIKTAMDTLHDRPIFQFHHLNGKLTAFRTTA